MSADKDVVFQRGRWSISKSSFHHYLSHQCKKESPNVWCVYVTKFNHWAENPRRILLRWRCVACSKQPPDSILGVYKLLETDFCVATEAHVRDHSKHP